MTHRHLRGFVLPAIVPLGCFCLLTGHTGRADNDEAAARIIQKAITSHGGKERLLALQKRVMTTKGTIFQDGRSIDYTAEKWEDLPKREKSVAKLKSGDMAQTEIRIIDGDNAWRKIDDEAASLLSGKTFSDMQRGLHTRYAMTLVPLLEDKSITLKALGESILDKRAVLGVRIIANDKVQREMFFDAQKGVLVRCVTKSTNERGEPTTLDEYMFDYKDFGGLKYPTRSIAFVNDKKLQERLVISLECLEKVESGMFKRP